MTNPNIAPTGAPEVQLEPEQVAESIKSWETTLLTLQRDNDLSLIDETIRLTEASYNRTGPRVSASDNPLGALTQRGFEQAIQALRSMRAKISSAPLVTIEYASIEYEAGADEG